MPELEKPPVTGATTPAAPTTTPAPPAAAPPDPTIDLLKGQLAESKGQIDALTGQVRMLAESLQVLAQPKVEDPKPLDPDQFRDDPEGSVATVVDRRVAPVRDQLHRSAWTMARSVARLDQRCKDWGKFEKEIDATAQGLTPDQKANPEAWVYLYNIVRAQHTDEIVNERLAEERKRWEQDRAGTAGQSLPTGAAGGAAAAATAAELTEEQRFVAKRFGMTDAEYAAELTAQAQDQARSLRRELGMEN